MKNISKLLFLVISTIALFASCDKKKDLNSFGTGKAVVLSSSASTIAPDRADSNKTAVTFSWTGAGYATDSAHTKYVLQIDTVGGNFKTPFSREIIGNLSATFSAKELNAVLIGFGLKPGLPYSIFTRVVSSYLNNNDQYVSNTLTINATPYLVPPKVVPPPASSRTLVLVGSATASGWDNPVALPAQGFTMIDTVTYEGTFFLNGGGKYVFLPLNGDWGHKYNVADNTIPDLNKGGTFGKDQGNADIPGPDKTGMYKILVDFQNGKFTVTNVSESGLLYVPGDYQGWAPALAQTLGSPANDGKFDGYVNIPGGTREFKFAATPDWSNAYGDGGSGTLEPGGPSNLSVAAPGFYHLTGNTVANTWSSEATTWGLIGSFAASTWNTDVPMTYDAANDKWVGTITTVAGDVFKFRANGAWALNYGDSDGKGSLSPGGSDIGDAAHNFALPAGTHTISLYLGNPGYYTYRIQ